MSKKTFVMLAAPGMIGKSFAAKHVAENNSAVTVLENDKLMQKLFGLVYLPQDTPIDKITAWHTAVDKKADCDAIIRLLHRDWVSLNRDSSIILAEGYPYMNKAYRDQVKSGLSHLGYDIKYILFQYQPTMEEQVANRAKKYIDYRWSAITPEQHRQYLEAQWEDFEVPANEEIDFDVVNYTSLTDKMRKIASQTYQGK